MTTATLKTVAPGVVGVLLFFGGLAIVAYYTTTGRKQLGRLGIKVPTPNAAVPDAQAADELCSKYADAAAYVAAIREKYPGLSDAQAADHAAIYNATCYAGQRQGRSVYH